MDRPTRPLWTLLGALFCLSGMLSCQERGGQALILEERSRYSVELLSWADRGDGTLAATLRITGPVHSSLQVLTVEIRRNGPGEVHQGSDWISLDLSEMVMGTALEKTIFLPSGTVSPDSLGVKLHLEPSPEVLPRLKELQGVP